MNTAPVIKPPAINNPRDLSPPLAKLAPNLAKMSPREMALIGTKDSADAKNFGIEGYFMPVVETDSKMPGYCVPRARRIGNIEQDARSISYIPAADKYKSPFEGDWVAQDEKKMKKNNWSKTRRNTVTDEIAIKASHKERTAPGSDKYSTLIDYNHRNKSIDNSPTSGHSALQS